MRLLIGEFITGGGLLNEPLPTSLANEGERMQQALIHDFAASEAITHIEVLRDLRLPELSGERLSSLPVPDDFSRCFENACDRADAVLPIAPESGGVLQRLTESIKTEKLLGSRAAAVTLATSKRATIDRLLQRGLAVIPYVRPAASIEPPADGWVVKPDDGVGGAGCRRLRDLPATWTDDHLLQPYVAGTTASLTLLCGDGRASLLAVNQQYIELDETGCRLRGIHVNGLLPTLTDAQLVQLQQLSDAVATALPDLWGFVGIDGIMTDGMFQILEINPRLTTAYCGLRESHDANPVAWLLELRDTGGLPELAMANARPVEVML